MKNKLACLVALALVLGLCSAALSESASDVIWQDGLLMGVLLNVDEEGNRAYIVLLQPGMVYGDGTPLSARDYVCALLLDDPDTGVRLMSNTEFELIIAPGDELPSGLRPIPPQAFGLEVLNGEQGAYLAGDVEHALALLDTAAETLELPELQTPLSDGLDGGEETPAIEEHAKGVEQVIQAPEAQPPAEGASVAQPEPSEQVDEPSDTGAPSDGEAHEDQPAVEPSEPDDDSQPGTDAGDAPAEEIPAEDTPAEDTPAEDTPAEDMPTADAPTEDAPSEDAADWHAQIDYRVEDPNADPPVVVLTCKLDGIDDTEAQLQWQVNDGSGWVDVPGATGREHRVEMTPYTATCRWRVKVLVVG